MVGFYCALAVLQNCINRLYHGIRRKSSVLFGKIHAPAGCVHSDPERICRSNLRTEQIAAVLREHIMMIEACCTTVTHQFRHACTGAQIYRLFVQIFPDAVKRFQPIKQFEVLNFAEIPRKILVQVVMYIDQPGINNHAFAVVFPIRCPIQ